MERKMVPLYRDKREMELWQRAEKQARKQIGVTAREGEVLAAICADYLDESLPSELDGEKA